jgi:hypothetical protein
LENNFWTEMCPVEFIESSYLLCHCVSRGHRGCDRIVVGFTTTYAISAYHHWFCEFESRSGRGVLDTTLCDKVCQWLATCRWFSLYPQVSSTNETDRHDITEILLKVALNTIKQTNIVCQCPLNYQWFLSVIDK